MGKCIAFIVISLMAISSEAGGKIDFSGRTWSLWPEKAGAVLEKESSSAVRIKAAGPSEKFSIYTYSHVKENRSYTISFSYDLEGGPGLCDLIVNYNKDGGLNGSAGSIKFQVDMAPDNRLRKSFYAEIQVPAGTEKCQISLDFQNQKGAVVISDFRMEEVKDLYSIHKTSQAPAIDGILDDDCWKSAVPLTNFYCSDNNAVPAKTQTIAYLSYDENNLYIAFKNEEEDIKLLKAGVTERDGSLWNDDCNEIFINVPDGKTYQFIANALGTKWDGTIYAKIPGDPLIGDAKWNGEWTNAPAKGKDYWTTEMCIPFSNFKSRPDNGAKWSINLARERKINPEISHFNRAAVAFNNVSKFASLKFSGDSAVIERYSEVVVKEPFKIIRKSPKYEQLLSGTPGNYKTAVWSSDCVLQYYPAKLKDKYTPETFAKEQDNILTEYASAHILGPAFPWLPSYISGGMKTVKKFHDEYGMKFWFALFSSAQDKAAITKGAKYVSGNFADPNNPEYQSVIENYIKDYFTKNKSNLRYIDFIFGKDEPMNNTFLSYSMTLNKENKAALLELDEKIKKDFGFGKFGLYDAYDENADKNTAPFRMIAFVKWWNSAFYENTRSQKALLEKYAPGIPFMAYNMNCVKGIGREDTALLAANTDYVSADPYPSSAMYNFGRERGIYHTGFSFKLLKDLSGGKFLNGFLQGFSYCGYNPSPSDIREWASQALKNGADGLNWFTTASAPLRVQLPETYKEFLRLSNVVHDTNKLKIPEETKTAIFFSNTSFEGNFDEAAHPMYTIYSILGEQLKTWFRFAGASGVALKMDTLSNYKLIYLPQFNYSDRATAEALLEYVKNGGCLVIFDPEAFSWNIDGMRLDGIRMELAGCLPGDRLEARNIVLTTDCFGLKKGDELPLTPLANRTGHGQAQAFKIVPSGDAKVFACYKDGSPAAFERNVGKGSVIYFAAQPFGNSELAVRESNWTVFMKSLAERIGEKSDLPIWDFELPATSGEIDVKYVINPDSK